MYAFLFALPLASAMPWEGPAPTPAGDASMQLGWSPMPTPEPAALFGVYELRRRQASASTTSSSFIHATCGYLNGLGGRPLTCVASGYSCAVDTAHSVFACCSNLKDCQIQTSCVPAASLSACDSNCVADPYVAKCNPTYAYCSENLLVVSTGAATYTNYYCTDFPTLVTQYATATDSTALSGSYVYITQTISSRPTAPTTTSTPSTSQPSTTNSGPSTLTVTPTPTTTSAVPVPGKKTPVGAIVGGVVGGLAVIGAIILGVLFFLRRKRNASAPATTPVAAPGPSPPTDPTFSGYYPPQEKEAPVPTNNGQERAEMYSPPQSPTPQYTAYSAPTQPVSQHVYPNVSEMDAGGTGISHHAAPGSY